MTVARTLVLILAPGFPAGGSKPDKEGITLDGPGVFWREPRDIVQRNLFYGSGGPEHQPCGPYRFLKEDFNGTSPKFEVADGNGVKWKVKLGQEARPETAASRLVWSAGYFTPEDYLVRDFRVTEMPERLKRGQQLIGRDGRIAYARFKRAHEGEKKIGIWDWEDPYWAGNREVDGLRALMALINNWDLKAYNNAVYQRGSERIYMVSDLGATFGSAGRNWPHYKSKDNLDEYRRSAFLSKVHGDVVNFQTPARPRCVLVVDPKEYFQRVRLETIGRKVPREHARWIGEILARLSERQIHDAFSAAGYSEAEANQFTQVVRQRISRLTGL